MLIIPNNLFIIDYCFLSVILIPFENSGDHIPSCKEKLAVEVKKFSDSFVIGWKELV